MSIHTTRTEAGGRENLVNTRNLLWDEENRLLGVSDNGVVSNYWYDASGERVIKQTGDGEGVLVNGRMSGARTGTNVYSIYVNPYTVIGNGKQMSKHFYIGSQRIASQLCSSRKTGSINNNPLTNTKAAATVVNYPTKYADLTSKVKTRYDSLYVPYNGTENTASDFWTYFYISDEKFDQFFYHPDHLGSSSIITNITRQIVQHLEYVPFGEVFVDERITTNHPYDTPFKFNAKELDEETGLYYYGARYYDPRTSLWLSVDPLAEKYPNFGSYVYCYNNPIVFIDPDGRQGVGDKIKQTYQQAATWAANHPEVTSRVDGALKLVSGVAEGVVGLAACCTGVTAGAAAVAHGSDVGGAGLNQLISGQFQSSTVSSTLQSAGVPSSVANAVDGGVSGALTAGASIGLIGAKSVSNISSSSVNNPVPQTLARVLPADINSSTLGASTADDVFVTAAKDIKGLNAGQIANKLTIPQSSNGFKVITFKTPVNGLSTPINRSNPGFVGFGKTAGGAREFTIPNQQIPLGAKTRIVR